uniref:Putative secreted protein n=1 Tax=Ixodes scapularis TaxID=6945 RepID=A0A4D5RYL7_IXOSC
MLVVFLYLSLSVSVSRYVDEPVLGISTLRSSGILLVYESTSCSNQRVCIHRARAFTLVLLIRKCFFCLFFFVCP